MPTAADADNHDLAAEDEAAPSPAEGAFPAFDPNAGNVAAILMEQVKAANAVADPEQRDMCLLQVLRNCRKELELAEVESNTSKAQLNVAKELFEFATKSLIEPSQAEALKTKMCATPKSTKKRPPASIMSNQLWKKIRGEEEEESNPSADQELTAKELERLVAEPAVPENPIHLPRHFKRGGHDMTPKMIAQHRDLFYRHLIKKPFSEVDSYQPSMNNANLKSKTQLEEAIHIVSNWFTGADGLDACEFRAKHKTWYSRLKPATDHLGRRTGIHLRQTDEGIVLCRHSKDGDSSIAYIEVGLVFDAIYEIHSVEFNHKGRDPTKARCDELYANITDAHVKAFIETCPVCCARKGKILPDIEV